MSPVGVVDAAAAAAGALIAMTGTAQAAPATTVRRLRPLGTSEPLEETAGDMGKDLHRSQT